MKTNFKAEKVMKNNQQAGEASDIILILFAAVSLWLLVFKSGLF